MTISRRYAVKNASGQDRVLVIINDPSQGLASTWRIDTPEGVTVARSSSLQGGGILSSPVAAVKSARRVLDTLTA